MSRVAAGALFVCGLYYTLTVGLPRSDSLTQSYLDIAGHHGIVGEETREGSAPMSQFSHAYTTTTWSAHDNSIKHYVLERTRPKHGIKESVIFLTITADERSWGRNPAEENRSIYSHLDLVTNTTLLPEQASIGLLTSSPAEYERYIKILTPPTANEEALDDHSKYFNYDFSRVVIILDTADTRAQPTGRDPATKSSDDSRKNRHEIPQHERRAILAKLRNYLTWAALAHETHVAWLDSDVYKFSSDTMMQTMMERTSTTEEAEVGILTSRCRRGEPEKAEAWMAEHPDFVLPDRPRRDDTPEQRAYKDEFRGREGGKYEILAYKTNAQAHYDLNAWSGTRTSPDEEEQARLWEDIDAWTPAPKHAMMLDGVIRNTNNDEIKRLDSVGGTILMINAELVRMGLIWPTGYTVNMSFEHGEGYDGIESEGLCLLTRSFSRDGQSMCFSMGGDWSVWHTVF